MKRTKDPSLKLMEKEERKMKLDSATCKVKFVGWRMKHCKEWESWVTKMSFVHKSTWENAGIYEAIMGSRYSIKRQDDLIWELAKRWRSQTNTFVFPWGEATLTLEDMSVLGGFSSAGVSALSSLENDAESLHIKEHLELVRKEIVSSSKATWPLQGKWMEKFKDSENDMEHAAFLSLWLSRYVFPVKCVNSGIVSKRVFPIAARLSRGIKLALGPAVLPMLYRDLSALSKRLHFTQLLNHSEDNVSQTNFYVALFHLVQIWAWERFPILQPVRDCTSFVPDFSRLARWNNVQILNHKDLKSTLDSAEETFLWRPYDSSFDQCIEAVELIGFDYCVEKYQPKRVARQFGLDHDAFSEGVVDFVPLGFSPRTEVIHIIDSDSDDDCNMPMTPEACKRESAQIKREDYEEDGITNKDQLEHLQHSNLVSPDEEVLDAFSVDKTEASERESAQIKREDYEEGGLTNKDQLELLQHSDLVSFPSGNDSNEANHIVYGSVHEARGDEGEEDADANNDEVQGMEGEAELATSCDTEIYMNEIPKDSGLDLEARISRLEGIVYAAIKELETAM